MTLKISLSRPLSRTSEDAEPIQDLNAEPVHDLAQLADRIYTPPESPRPFIHRRNLFPEDLSSSDDVPSFEEQALIKAQLPEFIQATQIDEDSSSSDQEEYSEASSSAENSPRSPAPIPETPVKRAFNLTEDATPDKTFPRNEQAILIAGLKKIAAAPLEKRHFDCERLIKATFEVLLGPKRCEEMAIFPGQSGSIFGMTKLKMLGTCWPMEVLRFADSTLKTIPEARLLPTGNRILLIDLTHICALEATQGGRSVRGGHLGTLRAGACINPRNGVWCALQKADSELKKSKFSTNLPLQYQNEKAVTELVNLTITEGREIAVKDHLRLYQVPNCTDFYIEIPILGITIPTLMPILHYDTYHASKIIVLDGHDGTKILPNAYEIPLQQLLPCMRANTRLFNEAIRYTLEDELIIDIAYFFKEAGIQCPAEKGILIRFPKTLFFHF